MSLILLIDSVHSELAVGLVRADRAVFSIHKQQKSHDKNLIPLITELLESEKVAFTDIDAYAVVVGPGSWTGCRVGVTAVKGFCAGQARPVFALNSLDALGDPSAIKSNLNKYYIKRGNNYTCEVLATTDGYATLESVGVENYRTKLIEQIKKVKPISAKELVPFYVTEFEVK